MIGCLLCVVVDLTVLGERQITLDCDVIQADGGTRTAAITGAMVALELAVKKLLAEGKLSENPIINQVAAVSIGLVNGRPCLDLDYIEDSHAETDLNLVMNAKGGYIEIQGTAEDGTFSRNELDEMLKIGEAGIKQLLQLQKQAMESK